MRDNRILKLEELGINAFPALLTEVYDGWVLRYSNGYTYRGNSINPLYISMASLAEKVIECENRYFRKGLPSVFKMTSIAEEGLDKILQDCDYKIEKRADLMIKKLDHYLYEEKNIKCSRGIEEEWLEQFLVLNGTESEKTKNTAKQMLKQIGNETICVAIYNQEKMIACGLGVIEQKYIGIYDVRVDEQYRRLGFGKQICEKIINEGIKVGAETAYLQVASDNEIACSLYNKLGFNKLYTYWYRVKQAQPVD